MSRVPRTSLEVLARVTRADAALALTMPALCGSMLAWWELGRLNFVALLFTLLGVLTTALGVNALGEYYDYKHSRVTLDNRIAQEPLATGYGLMSKSKIRPELAVNLGYMLLTIGLLCSLWLALLAGWPMLFFTGLSFLLTYTCAAPPIQLGFRGWAIGEVGIFLGYGLLQVWGSYYAQAQTLTWLSIWVSLPLGLLVMLVYFNYNFLHQRRDWLMRKRTLVVDLGVLRALDLSVVLVVAIYAAILAVVSIDHLPLRTLIVLLALPMTLGAFPHIRRERLAPEDGFLLYKTTVNAALLTGVIFNLALITDILSR